MQKYMFKLTRLKNGMWVVAGYWEVPTTTALEKQQFGATMWTLDGEPQTFNSKHDACMFIMNATGTPE